MPSHSTNRPARISVLSDQRRTKSTTWSRVSCATHTPVRSPQHFFLKRHAPPSARPVPRSWSGSSSPDTRSAPVGVGGRRVPLPGRRPPRSRRTPSATGRRPSAGAPFHHTTTRSAPAPAGAASGWRPSLRPCSACASFSCVLSVILTAERSLHFQLGRNNTSQTASNHNALHSPGSLGRYAPSRSTVRPDKAGEDYESRSPAPREAAERTLLDG